MLGESAVPQLTLTPPFSPLLACHVQEIECYELTGIDQEAAVRMSLTLVPLTETIDIDCSHQHMTPLNPDQ